MSDRYNYLTVVLERDLKDEDAEPLIAAIKQFRGVLSVTPNVVDTAALLAEERARVELANKLWEVLREKGSSN
jgi:DICT domain-containing protein